MANRTRLNLDVDLQHGVVPISKAASSLAALIKRTGTTGSPVIVTQKGYPTGVLLPIEIFVALKELAAEQGGVADPSPAADPVAALAEEIAAAPQAEEPAPPAPRPAARRRKPAKQEAEEVVA